MKISVILANARIQSIKAIKIATPIRNLAIITTLLLLVSFLTLPISTFAQESSPSGSIIDKINALKTEIASKAAQIKTEITKKVQNKAIMGTILDISSSEITIQTINSSKIIKYDEFTAAIGAKNKEIEVDTLEAGDKIAALGDVDDKNTLIAQKLIYLDSLASPSAQLVWGQIQKVSGNTITIKTQSVNTQTILTNAQTVFLLGNNEASILDAKIEQHLATRVTKLKDGSLRASFIYFIPSNGFTKPIEKSPSKPSSPSASPKK